MALEFLICPLCKYENPDGTRFCRKCGRLLVEPNQDASSTDRAPRYESQELAVAQPAPPDEDINIANAHVAISIYPDDFDTVADVKPTRLGEFLLGGRTVTVGRGQNCDIIFDKDTLASRRHAILRAEGRHYTVADLGSSNGTFVNDVEIREKTTIVHGDRILIGQHELLLLLDAPQGNDQTPSQPQTVIAATVQAAAHADDSAEGAASVAEATAETPAVAANPETQTHATGAPASATAKYASVARLSSELAASASRMAIPPKDGAELDEIRTRLIEASEALTRQAAAQAALAERRRAALVEARERVADLISDLRGDEVERESPTHAQPLDLIALVERVAEDPDNIESLRALARHAGEVAQALRDQGPSEGRWKVERVNTLRGLNDIQLRLQERI